MNKPETFPAVITIGKLFVEDHWDRECGLTDKVIRETKKTITVELDEDGWVDLYSDADYYFNMITGYDPEEGLIPLGRAAKRVIDKMNAYVGAQKVGA